MVKLSTDNKYTLVGIKEVIAFLLEGKTIIFDFNTDGDEEALELILSILKDLKCPYILEDNRLTLAD